MIRSMTGYGRSILELDNKTITIELRSLNSRYFDLNMKLPVAYKEKEIEMRNILSQNLIRGKVDVYLSISEGGVEKLQKINKELVKEYYQEMKEIADELNVKEDLLTLVMRMQNVVTSEEGIIDEDLWVKLKASMMKAIENLNEFRIREGDELEKDLLLRVSEIKSNLEKIEELEPERKDRTRKRLLDQMNTLFDSEKVDKNRFEEELIYYLEKMDITEEIVRLRTHVEYFMQLLEEKGWDKGKKLGFIGQELGREINTIGSKANDATIQKLVVQMKDDLEKIKEQVLNVL